MRILLCFFLLVLFPLSSQATEETVNIEVKGGKVQGTLLVPDNAIKPPVVLIIAGSGPTDRDGNQQNLQNNSLKQLADSLYNRGIASLRFDKRGIGASQIPDLNQRELRFEHFVADVRYWIGLLGKDKRFSRLIVAGHSEGALIGIEAAIDNPQVHGYVSLAGPSRPADEMIREQLAEQPQMIRDMVFPMLDTLRGGDTLRFVPEYLYALFHPSLQPYLMSWMKYDPRQEIKKLKVPVLIVQGTTDVQVLPEDAENLKRAYPAATVKLVENMNHIFKEFDSKDKRAQIATYNNPNLPLHKDFIPAIESFVKKIQ